MWFWFLIAATSVSWTVRPWPLPGRGWRPWPSPERWFWSLIAATSVSWTVRSWPLPLRRLRPWSSPDRRWFWSLLARGIRRGLYPPWGVKAIYVTWGRGAGTGLLAGAPNRRWAAEMRWLSAFTSQDEVSCIYNTSRGRGCTFNLFIAYTKLNKPPFTSYITLTSHTDSRRDLPAYVISRIP